MVASAEVVFVFRPFRGRQCGMDRAGSGMYASRKVEDGEGPEGMSGYSCSCRSLGGEDLVYLTKE